MEFSSLSQLLDGTKACLRLTNGTVEVLDERAFRAEAIDRLVYSAVFGSDDVREAARWIIWQAAWQVGVQSASIDALYQARAREEYHGVTVPAFNCRAMVYDMARAVVRAALARNVGAFIFELARSEIGYTFQQPAEYATVVTAAAIKEGYHGPIFIQGDHYQANAKRFAQDPQAEIGALKRLIHDSIVAGYLNIDIDASTLVDLSYPTIDEQQRTNYQVSAELAKYVRSLEPSGVTISIGGEIGEVGKKNSTVEELVAYVEGFNREFGGGRGLSKISVQTGTSHGGVVLPDGTIARVKIDFEALRSLSAAARRYGLGGAVQHGASTLPLEAFDQFPKVDTLEVHLATEFQNIIYDGGAFPAELKAEIYDFLRREFADERVPDETDEQFIYKTRKKAWGPFKRQVWDLPADTKAQIRGLLEQRIGLMYEKLGAINTRDLVDRYVKPVRVDKPQPAALRAVGV